MNTKTFEIRDRMTFIPVVAVQLDPGNETDRFLLARAGYGSEPRQQGQHVLLCQIVGGGGRCTVDFHDWGTVVRTFGIAHKYITENFDRLESGSVICVEHLLGERNAPKESEARYGF